MSVHHMRVAWLVNLPPIQKYVLLALADHACEVCGLCWPGVKSLVEKTGLSETATTQALKALRAADLITVHRYPEGGRGRATEYLVLPGYEVLPKGRKIERAPCGGCQVRMSFPPK